MAEKYIGYQCSLCRETYAPGEVVYTCPKDQGNLDIILDYTELSKRFIQSDFTNGEGSLWRYLPLLPVQDPGGFNTPMRSVGMTPFYELKKLAEDLGLAHLWLKDESGNPTASFKDRASAVVVARAVEIEAEVIVTASTGNAGAALAGMAAAMSERAVIFAPRSAPPAKVAQLLIYGADVLLVNGTYDDAFDLSIAASNEFGWYCRNTGYNPFTIEGKKTAAFEIWSWWLQQNPNSNSEKPLSIFVSVGDGNIISGIHKGFKDIQSLGWLEQMPRIFGVQSEGSAAVYNAFAKGSETILPVSANTLADSISVDLPRDGVRALRAASQTGGNYIQVSDVEILAAISALGRLGIFSEPAGAASYAGLQRAVNQGLIGFDDPVVVINTGNGLKDIKAAMSAASQAPIIEPDLDAVKEHFNG